MKIILDSNVIIAAFSSNGLCHSLFELCVTKYNIIISDHILSEVHRILHDKFKMPPKKVDEVIHYLKEFCNMQKYEKLKENVCRDKDDDEILALAKSASVDYIITGDKDLLILETFDSIPIISHWNFWQIAKTEINNFK
jgi:putative PIN family toxin of toxin-antitoxin system